MTAEIGSPAPAFNLNAHTGDVHDNASLRGSKALIVFIPFPFTGNCDGEACSLRDNLAELDNLDANVVVVTTHAGPTNKEWAAKENLPFPILADYWPHGEVARAFGCFNEQRGCAMRSTYVLDAEGVVRDIIATGSLGETRSHSAYVEALAAIE